MREAEVNIAIRWFIGYGLHEKLPHHSSLTRIRQRWGEERFRKIFKRTVESCLKAKIATGEIVQIDSSLIRANVSWDSLVERHVADVLSENQTEEETEVERKGRQSGKYKKVCTTDPDATMATNARNRRLEPAYKQHAAVDDKVGVILDVAVTTGQTNEGEMIEPQVDSGFGLFANSIFTTATTDTLAAVPLFIVMGELLFRSGTMEVLFSSLDRLVGRVRGRQYILCILLSAILGALSGAAMAVAGLLGRSLYPAMIERGYDPKLSAGTILGGASLDPIIPPSVLAVILAQVAQISTGKLLVAGFGPGILLTVMFLIYVWFRLWMKPSLAPDIASEDERKKGSVFIALLQMLPACFIFFLVMGLVMLGIATPTEAAATGVVGSLVLAYSYGGLSKTMLLESLYTGVTVSSLLLLIMCCAVMFSQLLTFAGAPQMFGELVNTLQVPVAVTIFIMLAIPFLLHILLFLDQVALFFILVPIYKPILALYGVDEIWFFTMLLIVATVGGISPPFGYTLFAMKSALPNSSMSELYKAAWPFVWIICFSILIIAIFPTIAT